MMNVDNLIERLSAERGIHSEGVRIIKNGIECTGIRIIDADNSSISPIIYYSEQESMEEILSRINRVVSTNSPRIEINQLTNWMFVKDRIFFSIQRQSAEKCVKRPFLNLELCLRIFLDIDGGERNGSLKLTPELLKCINVSEDEVWTTAEANSSVHYHTSSMAEMLGFRTSKKEDIYVVTSESFPDGASALYCPKVFRDFCQEHSENSCVILPSSTQELIVVPGSIVEAQMNVFELCNMIQTINADIVNPLIQLDPVVYRYSLERNVVEIVAAYERR